MALRPGGEPTSVDLGTVGDYRLRAMQGHDNDILITGLPLHPLNQTLAQLFVILLAVFIAVVALRRGSGRFRRPARPATSP